MKLSAFKPIQRRDLLKALGGAAFLLPGLELFEREARAQTAAKHARRRERKCVLAHRGDH